MIKTAIQKGRYIYIYNERGVQSASIIVSDLPMSGLQGFTTETVSVRQGNAIMTYDEMGHEVASQIMVDPDGMPRDANSNPDSGTFGPRFFFMFLIICAIVYFVFYA